MSGNDLPRFSGPEIGYGHTGIGYYEQSCRLPGITWAEGHMFTRAAFMPNCNMEDGVFNDTVWHLGNPGDLDTKHHDPVLSELFYSDAVRRLQAVEQLTLPPHYSTIPNTAAMSRFEHVWGSALFVTQIAAKHGLDQTETTRLQLRTLLSDVGQRTGSHLYDWLSQGIGGSEDQHDIDLPEFLEAVGLCDILRRNKIEPGEVIFPAITDWVEAPQPNLCVDRVDYGLREMNRWNDVVRLHGFSAEDFVLTPDNMLAMTDQRRARVFAEGYLLLSEENWSESTHRFVVDMLMLRTKLFYAQGGAPRPWIFDDKGLIPLHDIHPSDLMYVTDPAQVAAMAQPNLGDHILDSIAQNIAMYRRQYVWPARQERINKYMNQFADPETYTQIKNGQGFHGVNSSHFNSYLDEYPSSLAAGFAVLSPEDAAKSKSPQDIDFYQNPFKLRQVDPLVKNGADFKRLSQLDGTYAMRLAQHKESMKAAKVARISIPDKNTYQQIRQLIDNVDTHWQMRLKQSRRMTPGELKSLVSASANEIHGSYSFMSFLSF